jgi:hypothetical protein
MYLTEDEYFGFGNDSLGSNPAAYKYKGYGGSCLTNTLRPKKSQWIITKMNKHLKIDEPCPA